MPNEKVTYVTYTEGLAAKHLHLGNLVHSFKEPDSLDPYEEKAYTDIDEAPPSWAQLTSLENYALTLGGGADEDDSDDDDVPHYLVVASDKTTKLELKDPNNFFTTHTLTTPTAQKWLSAHLSAALSLPSTTTKPQIWMLTGLILMKHATWTSLSSSQTFTPGLQAPFDPKSVSAIRRSSVSGHVQPVVGYEDTTGEREKKIGGAVIHETGKYPGMRGWAARWEEVSVRAGDGGKGEIEVKVGGGKKSAVVELKAGSYAVKGKDDEEEDDDEEDDYWIEFLDKVDSYA